MAEKKKGPVTEQVRRLVEPVAADFGLQIWDIRYEKEGASWYLRIFIDKPGGVNIEDCENMSRGVDKLIDEADPIEGSYFLEVSSPGIERDLVRPEHFQAFIGSLINVRLIRPRANQRDFVGKLQGFCDGTLTIEASSGETLTFEKKETAYIRLYEDYEAKGDKKA